MTSQLAPVHIPASAGQPYDFGTHRNDFLVPRENALATEVFTTVVPGCGAVPLHVHSDMEQVFLFLSGLGDAHLTRDGAEHRCPCRPGDVLFVPAGWHHQVSAPGPEGVIYLTFNAFIPEAARIGDTALSHAQTADKAFDRATTAAAPPGALEVARCAEARFRPDRAGRVWPDDGPLDATLTSPPGSYRVRRFGPFEFVTPVTPVPRILDAALADELHALAGGLPLYAEGSQSPLAAKPPHDGSDIDVLLAVTSPAGLETAKAAAGRLARFARQQDLPLDPGVIHPAWLALPGFYSAVDLSPSSPDRQWFTATPGQRLLEAVRRQQAAMELLEHPDKVTEILTRSLADTGHADMAEEFRITPRWKGLL